MSKSLRRGWLVLACIPLFGCFTLTHYERVDRIRSTEPRLCVNYETPQTAEEFNRAVRKRWQHCGDRKTKEAFCIPFVCSFERSSTLAEDAFFNDQVQACDLNGDGLITDAEARIYRCRCEDVPPQPLVPHASTEPPLVAGPEVTPAAATK